MTVHVEFLCETDEVSDGAIFRPMDGAGSKMAAFNVRGAMLTRDDFMEVHLEAERLDASSPCSTPRVGRRLLGSVRR